MTDIPSGYSSPEEDHTLTLTLADVLGRLTERENFGMVIIPGDPPQFIYFSQGTAAVNAIAMFAQAGVIKADKLEAFIAQFQAQQG